MSRRVLTLLPLAGLLSLTGCGSAPDSQSDRSAARPADSTPASASAASRVEVLTGDGETLFRLERSDKGYSVEGASGKLASVKVEADRVKLADAGGTPLFKVKQKEGGFKLYREPAVKGGADVELANFWSGGGELQIKDGGDRQLYKGKDKGGKFEVTGPEGRTYVLKTKDDGLEVEDAAGKRLVRIKGLNSPGAALFCAAPEYEPLQKACVVAFTAGVAR